MFPRDEPKAATALPFPGLGLAAADIDRGRERAVNSPGESQTGALDVRGLTQAVRRGDATAFARFYDRYSFRLYKFLLVLARGNENEAREICQAVFIKLTKRFEVFDDEARLWAWLATLAKHAFIDHCRVKRRGERLVPLEELRPEANASENSVPLLGDALREILATLPIEERELIQAAYLDERPLQDLADASGQTYKAVQSRLGRLRAKLKEQLLKNLRRENKL